MFFKLFCYGLFWCVLCESFSISTIFSGLCLGYFTSLFVKAYLPPIHDYAPYPTTLWNVLKYCFTTFFTMYVCAFKVVYLIIKGNPSANVYALDYTDRHYLYTLLSAHTITLTPGTITLFIDHCIVEVLSFDF